MSQSPRTVEKVVVLVASSLLLGVPAAMLCRWAQRNSVQGAWLIGMISVLVVWLGLVIAMSLWSRVRGPRTVEKNNE